jgi:hypothetical protein
MNTKPLFIITKESEMGIEAIETISIILMFLRQISVTLGTVALLLLLESKT